MRSYLPYLFVSLFLCAASGLCKTLQSASAENMQTLESPKKKAQRRIGSAWRQAIQHVYIPSADEKKIAPATTSQAVPAQSAQAQPSYRPEPPKPANQPPQLPSQEEMRDVFSHLEALLNDDELLYEGDDDDDLVDDDEQFSPEAFSAFLTTFNGTRPQ